MLKTNSLTSLRFLVNIHKGFLYIIFHKLELLYLQYFFFQWKNRLNKIFKDLTFDLCNCVLYKKEY